MIMDSVKPKRFSEVYPNESTHLVDALLKTTNHELFYCGKCDEPIPTQDIEGAPKFCTKCGSKIDWSDRYPKYYRSCPECCTTHRFENQFCRFCGIKLDEPKKERF